MPHSTMTDVVEVPVHLLDQVGDAQQQGLAIDSQSLCMHPSCHCHDDSVACAWLHARWGLKQLAGTCRSQGQDGHTPCCVVVMHELHTRI